MTLRISLLLIALILPSCDYASYAYETVTNSEEFHTIADESLRYASREVGEEISLGWPGAQEAKRGLDQVQLRALQNYINIYRASHHRTPNSLQELTHTLRLSNAVITNPWNCQYYYHRSGASYYEIVTLGADCRRGGRGADGDYGLSG